MEREAMTWEEECNVVPQLHAGGAMAMTAYNSFKDPVIVEFIQADAGIDIGDTFIGMHMKHVTVPVRLLKRNWGSSCDSLSYSPLRVSAVSVRYIMTHYYKRRM